MSSIFSKLYVYIFVSMIIYSQMGLTIQNTTTVFEENQFPLLKPGVYFKYLVYNLDSPTIILENNTSGEILVVNYMVVYWRILNISSDYLTIEYVVELNTIETSNSATRSSLESDRIVLRNKLLVNKYTLDTYRLDNSSRDLYWLGEWIYLINSNQLSERGLKLVLLRRNNNNPCIIHENFFSRDELRDFVSKLDSEVRRLTNNTKSLEYSFVENGLLLTNNYFGFIEIYPPPSDHVFKFKNTVLSRDRVVFGKTYVSLYITDAYINLFNNMYNTSTRPIYFYTLRSSVRNYTVLIDGNGETYCMIPLFITRVLYDSVSRILLFIQGMIEHVVRVIFTYTDLDNVFKTPYYPSGFERACIELIDTNIDLSEFTHSEQLLPNWFIAVITSSAIVIAIYIILRVKRLKKPRS